ncbi:MAG: PadR family transcriptional regulator [Candidatus Izemoplasmatales bacterium]
MKMDKAILDNLKSELRRGTQILSVLSLLDKNQYGYSLLQDLENKNVQIEAGTLYPLLRRLETQGILKSEWDTSESRPRKYYVLSSEGKEVYLELKDEWFRIVSEMNGILGGESK